MNLIWTSSDASVAYVDAFGVVTAKKCGTATITVTTQDGSKTATCAFTVTGGGSVTGVSLNKTTLTLFKAGYPQRLIAYVLPNNACNQAVTWSSSNTAIATVDNYGNVSAVDIGSYL